MPNLPPIQVPTNRNRVALAAIHAYQRHANEHSVLWQITSVRDLEDSPARDHILAHVYLRGIAETYACVCLANDQNGDLQIQRVSSAILDALRSTYGEDVSGRVAAIVHASLAASGMDFVK